MSLSEPIGDVSELLTGRNHVLSAIDNDEILFRLAVIADGTTRRITSSVHDRRPSGSIYGRRDARRADNGSVWR
ncbi:MAG: hypothetical protein Q6370_014355 [Candidatus Sigynarchaeota archaeon]